MTDLAFTLNCPDAESFPVLGREKKAEKKRFISLNEILSDNPFPVESTGGLVALKIVINFP